MRKALFRHNCANQKLDLHSLQVREMRKHNFKRKQIHSHKYNLTIPRYFLITPCLRCIPLSLQFRIILFFGIISRCTGGFHPLPAFHPPSSSNAFANPSFTLLLSLLILLNSPSLLFLSHLCIQFILCIKIQLLTLVLQFSFPSNLLAAQPSLLLLPASEIAGKFLSRCPIEIRPIKCPESSHSLGFIFKHLQTI